MLFVIFGDNINYNCNLSLLSFVTEASLSEPNTSEKCGVIDHTQKIMTKIRQLMCAKRIQ